jgi:hypothetical protein
MDCESIILGQAYECKPVGMENRIVGEVIRKMEKCVVMSVVKHDDCDLDKIEERCGRVVTRYTDIYDPALVESFFS